MDIKVALALAGGGARGAYQAGAMLALAKHGLYFNEVAGTSVGTLNGAFYAQSDGSIQAMESLCNLWREIGNTEMVKVDMLSASKSIAQGITWLSSLVGTDISLLDPGTIVRVMDNYISYDTVCKSSKNLIITVLPSISSVIDLIVGKFRSPHYFFANQMKPEQLRQALLAATAIPVAFSSVSVGGKKYSDAGLSMPLPSKILYDLGHLRIVSIFLSDDTIQNRFDYPNCNLVQIRPSVNINIGLGSMLDFSLAHIENLIKMGEADATKYIAEIEELFNSLVHLRCFGDELGERVQNIPDII